jgi:uncharacterized MnhB-related membrane protein
MNGSVLFQLVLALLNLCLVVYNVTQENLLGAVFSFAVMVLCLSFAKLAWRD